MLAVTPQMVAQAFVNLLAIGGGFLLGFALAWLGFWLLAPTAPGWVKKPTKLLAGVGLAVLVGFIVFGHGDGWTLFGGGGTASANGTGPTEQPGQPPAAVPATPAPAPTPPPTPPTVVESGEKVRVTVLGGTDVRDERFYRVDADPAARTFAELVALLDGKRAGKALRAEVVFPATNTLPRDHPAVTRLTRWAAAHGVTVSFPAS